MPFTDITCVASWNGSSIMVTRDTRGVRQYGRLTEDGVVELLDAHLRPIGRYLYGSLLLASLEGWHVEP